MIFKGKKSKTILVVGATLVMLAFSTSALAAIPYTTVTTYNTEDSTVTVTSTVTLSTADEVAYLVQKNGATSEDPRIIFIDQKPSVANVALPFSFKTSVDNVNAQATVKFGAMTTTEGFAPNEADAKNSTLQIGVKNITVNPGANGNVVASKTTLFDGEGVTFTITPDTDYELDTVTQNSTVLDVAGSFTLTAAEFEDNDVFNFTFKSTTQVPSISTPTQGQIVPIADAIDIEVTALVKTYGSVENIPVVAKRTSTVFAAANPGTGNRAVSYGMLFSKDQALLAAVTTDAAAINALAPNSVDIKKFASYGSNASGQFAIRLIDGGSGLLQSDYYTRTYIIYEPTAGGAQTAILGNVVTVTVN